MKIQLGIELRGDLTIEEEKFLQSQIDEKLEKTKNLQKYVSFLLLVVISLYLTEPCQNYSILFYSILYHQL
jgi:hypothetical protein